MNSKTNPPRIGTSSAASFVVANMIGVGVFTSLGFQLFGTHDLLAVIMLWVVGAIIALAGALSYGELGATMPRSGGEYNYLSKIYHPSVGFLSGWVSLTIGFAAPVALSSIAFASYSGQMFSMNADTVFSVGPFALPAQKCLAIALLTLVTAVHCIGIKIGASFQRISTVVNIAFITVFVACGILITKSHIGASFIPSVATIKDMFKPDFAKSLVYVSYAYSGWNAAAYIAGDIDTPQKKLPLALIGGTLLVAVLYIALNTVFLSTAPVSELVGKVEIGFISGQHIFGTVGGMIVAVLISLLLLSSVSSMVFVGPRVTQVVGEDLFLFSWFSKKNRNGSPAYAILFQSIISVILILSSTFDKVMTYVGFTLNLFTFMAVLGVFVHRIRFPKAERPYKTWGFPITPLIFLVLTAWFMWYIAKDKPVESIAGFLTVLSGLIVYWIDGVLKKRFASPGAARP